MKKSGLAAALLFLSIAFANAQVVVQGDKKANIDFTKYKSYAWLKDAKQNKLVKYTYEEVAMATDRKGRVKPGEVVVYSYSFYLPSPDSAVNSTLKKSIDGELQGRGYKKESGNPDLLVSYRVFDKSTNMKGYNNEPTKTGATETYTPSDTVTYSLKPGSVYITLIDAKTSEVIWEGSASGIAKSNEVISERMKLKEAVNLIFKKYEFRGDKTAMN